MRLTIVRHGETVENRDDICQGQKFGTLSELGIEQAKKLALRLKDEKFDIVYCSDLERAKKTCAEIIKFHPEVKVVFVPDIREQSKGDFEGKPHKLLREHYDVRDESDFRKIKVPSGESFEDLEKRVWEFYDKTINEHMGQSVLWVTHGGVIVTVLMKVLGVSDDKIRSIVPENTAVSVIEVDENGEHKAHLVNCVEHL